MKNLLDDNFEFIICSVTTNGLDDRWLGKKITYADLEILENLSKKFQVFFPNFENGEQPTFLTKKQFSLQRGSSMCFGKFWNILESFGTFWIGIFGTFLEVPETCLVDVWQFCLGIFADGWSFGVVF